MFSKLKQRTIEEKSPAGAAGPAGRKAGAGKELQAGAGLDSERPGSDGPGAAQPVVRRGGHVEGERGGSVEGEKGRGVEGERGGGVEGERGGGVEGEKGRGVEGERGGGVEGERGRGVEGERGEWCGGSDGEGGPVSGALQEPGSGAPSHPPASSSNASSHSPASSSKPSLDQPAHGSNTTLQSEVAPPTSQSEGATPTGSGQLSSLFGLFRRRAPEDSPSSGPSPGPSPGPSSIGERLPDGVTTAQEKDAPTTPTSHTTLDGVESLSHEELLAVCRKQRQLALRYKGRFTELMEGYRSLQQEMDALRESERRSQRKISELLEVQQLDQQAKAHLEGSYQLSLEEKDEKIGVLQMQVKLMKERVASQEDAPAEAPARDTNIQELKSQLSTQDALMVRYKEALRAAKDRVVKLQGEKEMMSAELRKKTEQIMKQLESSSHATASEATDGEQSSLAGLQSVDKVGGPSPREELALAEAMVALKAEVESKGARISQLEKEMAEAKAMSRMSEEELKVELDKLKATHGKIVNKLRQQGVLLEEKSKVLVQELSDSQQTVEQLRETVNEKERTLQEHLQRSAVVADQHSVKENEAREEVRLLEARMAALQDEVDAMKARTAGMVADLEGMKVAMENKDLELVSANERLVQHELDFKVLDEKASLFEEEKRAASSRVESLQREAASIDDITSQKNIAEARITELEGEVQGLREREAELEALQKELSATLESQAAEKEQGFAAEAERLQSESASRENDLKAELQRQEGVAQALIEEKNALEKRHRDQFDAAKHNSDVALSELQAELDRREEHYLSNNRQLEEDLKLAYERNVSELKQRHTEAEKRASEAIQAEAKRLHSEFDKERDSLKAQLQQMEAHHVDGIASVTARVASMEAGNSSLLSQLESERQEHQAAVQSMQAEMEAISLGKEEHLSSVTQTLRSQVEASQSACHKLQASLDALRTEHMRLRSELDGSLAGRESDVEALQAALSSKELELSRLAEVKREEGEAAHLLCHKLEERCKAQSQELASVREAQATSAASHTHELACLEEKLLATERAMQQAASQHGTQLLALRQEAAAREAGYKSKVSSHEADVCDLEQRLSEATSQLKVVMEESSGLQREVAQVKETCSAVVQGTKEQHTRELAEVSESLEGQIATLSAQLKSECQWVQELKEGHRQELEAVENTMEGRLAKLKQAHKENLQQIQEAHTANIGGLKESHACELASLRKLHEHEAEQSGIVEEEARSAMEEQDRERALQLEKRHKVETEGLQAQLAASEALVQQTKQELSLYQQQQCAEVEVLQGVWQEKMEASTGAVVREREEMRTALETELHSVREAHSSEMQSLNERHAAAIAELKASSVQQIKKLKVQWKEKVSQMKVDMDQKEALQSQVGSLHAAKQQLEAELRAATQDHSGGQARMQARVIELESSLKERDESLTELVKEREGITRQLAVLEQSLQTKEDEVEEVNAKLSLLGSEAEAKHQELRRRAEVKLAQMKRQLTVQLERQDTEHRDALISLEEEKTAAITSNEVFSSENALMKEKMEALESSIKQLQVAGKQQEEAHREEMGRLLETMNNKGKELLALESRLEEHSLLLTEKEQEARQSMEECKRLEGQLAEEGSNMQSLSEERTSLTAELLTTRASLSELQSAVELEREASSVKVAQLKERAREAEQAVKDVEGEWKGKLDEMLVAVNIERQNLLDEQQAQASEFVSREHALKEQLAGLRAREESLSLNVEQAERQGSSERELALSRIHQLEQQCCALQEEQPRELAAVRREAEATVTALRERHQKELASAAVDIEARLRQSQLEAEAVARQEGAVAREGLEERYALECAEIRQRAESLQVEVQKAQEGHLAEADKVARMEQQLLEFQSAHQSELDVLRAQHEQGCLERDAEVVTGLRAQLEQCGKELRVVRGEHSAVAVQLQQRKKDLELQRREAAEHRVEVSRLKEELRNCRRALEASSSQRRPLEVQQQWQQVGGPPTPSRPCPRPHSPDTPSKEVHLSPEPHGAEFEYFRNVLFEYMMGRQSKHLIKPIAALARFSEKQKRELFFNEF